MPVQNRLTRASSRRTGSNSNDEGSSGHPRPPFLARLTSGQSLRGQASRTHSETDGVITDSGIFSRQESNIDDGVGSDDIEGVHSRGGGVLGPPAARRLFHQFRASRQPTPGYEPEHHINPTPQLSGVESDSDASIEASYLASHPAARANQHFANGHVSPSIGITLSPVTNLSPTGRNMNQQEVDEDLEQEVEEYEGTESEGDQLEYDDLDEYLPDGYDGEEIVDELVEDLEDDVERTLNEGPLKPSEVGLKEISNLAKFTVNSYKHGNGVEELRSDDLKMYWQSDGPQPHKLTIYFIKRVSIRVIRFFVNFNEDESYTPTKVLFRAGTSENHLVDFAGIDLTTPVGWQDVPIQGCGGGSDGNSLVAWVLQMIVHENHQNGKDTHLRGIKIYTQENEERALGGDGLPSIESDHTEITPGLEIMPDLAEPVNPIAVTGGTKRRLESRKQSRLAQEATLDDWASEALLSGPGSVANLKLR